MKLTLLDTKMELDQDLINGLNAKAGDRIDIQYLDMGGNLVPNIFISEGGNKLTKSNTVSFRGNKRNALAVYGTNFIAEDLNGLIILKGDGNRVFTKTYQAAQERIIDLKLLLDTQYNLNKFKYEF